MVGNGAPRGHPEAAFLVAQNLVAGGGLVHFGDVEAIPGAVGQSHLDEGVYLVVDKEEVALLVHSGRTGQHVALERTARHGRAQRGVAHGVAVDELIVLKFVEARARGDEAVACIARVNSHTRDVFVVLNACGLEDAFFLEGNPLSVFVGHHGARLVVVACIEQQAAADEQAVVVEGEHGTEVALGASPFVGAACGGKSLGREAVLAESLEALRHPHGTIVANGHHVVERVDAVAIQGYFRRCIGIHLVESADASDNCAVAIRAHLIDCTRTNEVELHLVCVVNRVEPHAHPCAVGLIAHEGIGMACKGGKLIDTPLAHKGPGILVVGTVLHGNVANLLTCGNHDMAWPSGCTIHAHAYIDEAIDGAILEVEIGKACRTADGSVALADAERGGCADVVVGIDHAWHRIEGFAIVHQKVYLEIVVNDDQALLILRPGNVENIAARHTIAARVVARIARGCVVGTEVAIRHQIDDIAHRNSLCGIVVGEMKMPGLVSLGSRWRHCQPEEATEKKDKVEDFTHDAV